MPGFVRWVGLIGALMLTAVVAVAEKRDEAWGPAVGTGIPHDLTATDQHGVERSFATLAAPNGLVIFFVRSADWCPFCQRQIVEVNDRLSDFTERGVNVVAISYDPVDVLADFGDQYDIGYPLLSDNGSRIIRAFGILNEREKPATPGYGIPHPGVVITDARGVVVATFAERSYKKRPRIDQLLKSTGVGPRSD